MKSEFKEKTYETGFVRELGQRTHFMFAPDQCDEHLLGYDLAAQIPWELWNGLPYMRRTHRLRLYGISAQSIRDYGQRINATLPPFKLNTFIQFKRCDRLTRSNSTEWPSWEGPYYRYDINNHQQETLQRTAELSNGRCIALFSAPAFHLSRDLFEKMESEEVIIGSNIVDARHLHGHNRFTYQTSGNYGVGHSEPEIIESMSFEQILNSARDKEGIKFTQHIKLTAEAIGEAVSKDDGGDRILVAARRAITGGELSEIFPRADGSWYDALITVLAFQLGYDCRVCMISTLE